MKTLCVIGTILVLVSALHAEALVDPSTIALMDVSSSSYDAAKTRLLTDVLRSELF
jgi:hypothetical protein